MAVISSLLVKLGFDVEDPGAPASKISSAAGKFAIAGGVVGAAVGAGVIKAMNVEAANDKLAAQLGATPKMAEKLGKVAGNLYSNAYGDSLESVNGAVAAVQSSIEGMGTASAKTLEKATARALDFATTFDVDVNRAVQVAGQAVSTGLARNATQAFDLITAASQRVPANLREDVLDAADEYGQFFATLGYDGEQAFAMLVDGAEKGMYGIDKIGDAVKEFTIRSTDMSTSSKDAYAAIGLDAQAMANKVLAGGKSAQSATQQVVDGLLKIKDPAKQANTAIALFGTPLEDLNASEIPAFLAQLQGGSDAMRGFKGAADEMGQTLNDNASTNLTAFTRTLTTGFVNVVGGIVLPLVNRLASTLATEFGPAVSAGFAYFQTTALPALQRFGSYLSSTFGPIFERVRSAVTGFLTGTNGDVSKYLGEIQATFNDVVSIVTTLWNTFGSDLMSYASKAFGNVKQIVTGAMKVISGIIKTVSAIMRGDWGAAWEGIQRIVSGAKDVVVGLLKQLFNLAQLAVSAGWKLISSLFSTALDGLKKLVMKGLETVLEFFQKLPGRILEKLGDLGSLLLDIGGDIIGGLVRGIRNTAGRVIEVIKETITDKLPGFIKDALGIASPSKVMADIARWIPEGIAQGIADRSPKVLDAMRSLVDRLKGSLTDLRSAFGSLSDSVASTFTPDLFKATSVHDFITNATSAMGSLDGLRKAWRKLSGWGIDPQFLANLFASGNGALILDMASGDRISAQTAAWAAGQVSIKADRLGDRVASDRYGKQTDRVINKLDSLEKAIKQVGADFGNEINSAVNRGQRRRAPV